MREHTLSLCQSVTPPCNCVDKIKMEEKPGYKWVPVISDYCTGCGKCVDKCPHSCLKPVWDFATLESAGTCTSIGDCIQVCEDDAIHMQWVKMKGDVKVGEWCENPPKPVRKGLMAVIMGMFGESTLHPEYAPSPEKVADETSDEQQ